MAGTTVRVTRETNRKLSILQARKIAATGRRSTKGSVIRDLVDRALAREGQESMILFRGPKYPLPKKIQRMILESPVGWGVTTSEEDIDRVLYGETE